MGGTTGPCLEGDGDGGSAMGGSCSPQKRTGAGVHVAKGLSADVGGRVTGTAVGGRAGGRRGGPEGDVNVEDQAAKPETHEEEEEEEGGSEEEEGERVEEEVDVAAAAWPVAPPGVG